MKWSGRKGRKEMHIQKGERTSIAMRKLMKQITEKQHCIATLLIPYKVLTLLVIRLTRERNSNHKLSYSLEKE